MNIGLNALLPLYEMPFMTPIFDTSSLQFLCLYTKTYIKRQYSEAAVKIALERTA